MSVEATQYTIGAEVRCEDATCGKLTRVVVDPVARKLTHIVVDPGGEPSRLVPLGLVGSAGDHRSLELSCSEEQFTELPTADETEFLPGSEGDHGYSPEQIIAWPFFSLGAGAVGTGGTAALIVPAATPGGQSQTATHERVPYGEVTIRRGANVEATDGSVGQVQGLVVDPQDHGVTHVLLQEGHLWGRKTVAVPIDVVAHVGGNVRVELTKAELGDLPPVDLT